MPHEDFDARFGHRRRPMGSPCLASCLWTQSCLAQDHIWESESGKRRSEKVKVIVQIVSKEEKKKYLQESESELQHH